MECSSREVLSYYESERKKLLARMNEILRTGTMQHEHEFKELLCRQCGVLRILEQIK